MSVATAEKVTGLTPPDIYLLRTVSKWLGVVKPAGQTRISSGLVDRDRLDALEASGHVRVVQDDLHPVDRVSARITNLGVRALETWEQVTGR